MRKLLDRFPIKSGMTEVKMSKKKLSNLPKHVVIIMDGNRRWARSRGFSVLTGHNFVMDRILEPLVDRAIERGIAYLTFWAFSTENWERDRREVEGIMRIFRKGFSKSAEVLHKKGVRLKIIGDLSKFPKDIQTNASKWVETSRNNRKITVCFALNYGGRDEILRAVNRLIKVRLEKAIIPRLPGVSPSPGTRRNDRAGLNSLPALSNSIDEDELTSRLDTAGMPDPDLIIRTGGEQRLSGFMLWQCAYSELYFTKMLMPDFSPREFDRAIDDFLTRKRRFGK